VISWVNSRSAADVTAVVTRQRPGGRGAFVDGGGRRLGRRMCLAEHVGYAVVMTTSRDQDKTDYAGENPLSDGKALEDQDGPEASTLDSGGGPNESEDPAADESPEGERP
jgi:hypothetical protein